MRSTPRSVAARFWEKVMPEPNSGCWLWTGCLTSAGYSQLMTGSKKLRTARIEYGHRISYEMHFGPIPEGLHVDHKCQLPCCVNPQHLQILDPNEHKNVTFGRLPVDPRTTKCAAKTHCPEGHELSGRNLILFGPRKSFKACRKCRVAKQQARRAAEKEMAHVAL